VINLARAIPLVLDKAPDTCFRFVGRPIGHPRTGEDMDVCLRRLLGAYSRAVEFLGYVPYEKLPDVFAETSICVFPSIWENFPNTCLESMAAARAVVGSSAGGMADMIDSGRNGLLTPPERPRRLEHAILSLLENPDRAASMGAAARETVLARYCPEAIGPVHEASYSRAMMRARPRPPDHDRVSYLANSGAPRKAPNLSS
jgi:glycosyltransferase involved in cell wall biosynthesis